MATDWVITTATERVPVHGRSGKLTFTVTNRGSANDTAMVDVRPEGAAARSWFHIDKPQRQLDGGQSDTFVVTLAVPKNARTGQYWFEGIVYSANTAPEEFSRSSGRITFFCRTASRWWLWLAIAAVWVAAAAAIAYVFSVS